MIAKLQKGETAARYKAAPTAANPLGVSEERNLSGRRLRNRIILVNAIAWSVIIALILRASL
jgi:hypothetical protein